jgi:hypothetical protein
MQVGQYAFLDPFRMYSALFAGVRLGLVVPGAWGIYALFRQVQSSPDPALHRDWSHTRLGGEVTYTLQLSRDQRVNVRLRMFRDGYTTTDSLDNHAGRVDQNLLFSVRYRPGRLGRFRPFLAYTFQRRAVSGSPTTDVFKDYTDHRFRMGLETSLRLR